MSDFRKNQYFLKVFFLQNPENSLKFAKYIICGFFNFATFSKNQLDSFVDLEKPEKMRIWLLS